MEKDWEAEIRRLARDLSNAREHLRELQTLETSGKTREELAALHEEVEMARADVMLVDQQLWLAKSKYAAS